MELERSIRLVNNAYHAEVNLARDGLTPVEAEAVSNYGEPTIEAGGTFDDGVDLTYDLPADDRRFPSQFPVKAVFSRSDYPDDANARAVLWYNTIRDRIEAAVEALRAIPSGTTGRDISNIDTTPA